MFLQVKTLNNMETFNLDLSKYKQLCNLTTKAVEEIYESDVIKKDMQLFFNPNTKEDKALLFGAFAKYHHGKIKDAFITCEKNFKHTGDSKFKSIKYLLGIIKRLK
jgi:hypothetical protein